MKRFLIFIFVTVIHVSTFFAPTVIASDSATQKAVLVTGASSGIGLKITGKLASNGFYVYAGARKAADLERLDAMDNVSSVRLDVTVQQEIDAAVEFVKDQGRGLYGVVNNAGSQATPDFVQVNYSITERRAEQRLLPLARDTGLGVLINRPFMNGAYFKRLGRQPLPGWAADFDCDSWAQFSLKYILAHPAVTCVLTETSNPLHMKENALSSLGRMPDESARARMRDFIDTA